MYYMYRNTGILHVCVRYMCNTSLTNYPLFTLHFTQHPVSPTTHALSQWSDKTVWSIPNTPSLPPSPVPFIVAWLWQLCTFCGYAGRLYAIGGYDGQERLNTVEVFDPELAQWKLVAPMNCRRRYLKEIIYHGYRENHSNHSLIIFYI